MTDLPTLIEEKARNDAGFAIAYAILVLGDQVAAFGDSLTDSIAQLGLLLEPREDLNEQ
jgi:hypothetical protein